MVAKHNKTRIGSATFGIAIVAFLLLVGSIAVSAATSTTLRMQAGDSAHVTCPTRLSRTTLSTKDWNVSCRASASPSTTSTPPPTSTSTTTTSTPPPTSTSTTPPPSGTWKCTVSGGGTKNCGPFAYNQITNSNGYNTYVSNNCWADPNCSQTVNANSPGDWQVVSTEPRGNTGVMTYPDIQQLMNDYCPGTPATWNCSSANSDTPISGLKSLTSTYAEVTPHNSQTIAQFAWDIWLSNTNHSDEIMVWVDNSNRGSGGATQIDSFTLNGQSWTVYTYGGIDGEIIVSLGAPGTFAQQGSGTVDLLAILNHLQSKGYVASGANTGQIDAGWEICSTGGTPETFSVSNYSLSMVAN